MEVKTNPKDSLDDGEITVLDPSHSTIGKINFFPSNKKN